MLGVGETLPDFKVTGVKPKFNRHEENGESAFETVTQDSFPGKWKVIFVSPTSFLAYLQTVMQGLKALKIEEKAVEIQQRVGELGKHVAAYEQFYKKLGVSLSTSVSHYNAGYKELGKIDKDVYRISESKIGIEPELLDKPGIDVLD